MEAERGSSRGAALKPSELLPACIDIIGTFEPGKTTVDSHHAAYCARHKVARPRDALLAVVCATRGGARFTRARHVADRGHRLSPPFPRPSLAPRSRSA